MDGLGSLMQHDVNMTGPSGQLQQLHTASVAASADPAVHALLERLNQLETYKNHLEHENKQMHQQLQVLSGFLNVVSTSVRTTENMLFSSVPSSEPPHMHMAAEGSQMQSTLPSNSTLTALAGNQLPAQTPTPTGMQRHPSMLNTSNPNANSTGTFSNVQQAAAPVPQTAAAGNAAAAVAAPPAPADASQQPSAAAANNSTAANGDTANGAAPTAAAANGRESASGTTGPGYRRRSSQAELAVMDGSATAAAAANGSRKRPRAEAPPSPQPPAPSAATTTAAAAAAAAATSSAALAAAAAAAAANFMPVQQQQQQQQQQLAQMQQMQQLQQLMPLGFGASEITLRLTKVHGKTVLHGDPVMIYRVELARNGVFEKYLFLPNDAIPVYGIRSWQHRDAIPPELLKMVENCLTTKAVASEQYVEEIKTMKAYMLQQCPHLARWGLGSNKVRLVTESGLRDLVTRLHRTMQKHGTVVLPKQLEVDLSWITSPDLLQIPVQAWSAPVYSRRLQNPADEAYATLAAPYGVPVIAAAAAGSSSGLGPATDNSPSASGITANGLTGVDIYQAQQQMVPCAMPNMMPVMMQGANGNQQQQYSNAMYYNAQQEMAMQQHSMMQQQGLPPTGLQQHSLQAHASGLGSANAIAGGFAANMARQGSNVGDQGIGPSGYTVNPGAAGASVMDSNGHGSGHGSRADLHGSLLPHGSSAASTAIDVVLPSAVTDPAALAGMPVPPEQQQQQPQEPQQLQAPQQEAVAAADNPKQQPQQVQQGPAPLSPVLQQQQGQGQQQQQSPGARSNGSTDSTMADAVAGLQALSRHEQAAAQPCPDQQQQQQCDAPKKTGDVQPERDQQQHQPAATAQQQQQQTAAQEPSSSRQGSAPSPDATVICNAAVPAIAVQQ